MLRCFEHLFERPLKIGTFLRGRFQILRYIGKGSYGQVYLAFDQDKKQTVVVKQHRERKDKKSKEMLKKEAITLSKLNHPSIPKYIDLFQENQKWFLVMDYIDGSNFEDLILNGSQTYGEKESLQILVKVLIVVKYLHENQLIHRDLRLPNIINKEGQLFVIDFGLAVFGEIDDLSQTANINPEKTLFREQSFKSDFYALGHFLLFLLYSRFQPTSQKEQSWEEELTITTETKNIIRKLLRIKGQYHSIDEVLHDVEALIEKL